MMTKLKMKHVLVLTIAAARVLLFGWAGVEAADHTTDSLETVKERIKNQKAVLVDVREMDEWDAGHVEGAIFAPLKKIADNEEVADIKKTLPKDKILYFHCKSGGRCRIAADLLKNEGFDIRPLKPGYKALIEAGFEKAKE
ncbi:MAG: rhodanese-like domain-containing protein [Planctomycetaceae bacterium]|nr:rhodanese-like domain-containing protein [Planctomycetaceae bacterium]